MNCGNENMKAHHQAYLEQYLQTLSEDEKGKIDQVVAEYFCADEWNANECAKLVSEGTKTATCSLHAAYAADGEPLPEKGRLMIVLDWDEQPVCIIETTEVTEVPFYKITAEFAYAEGEGDRSYESWRKAHIGFFEYVCEEVGLEWSEDKLIVCERFKVVYRGE